MFESNVDSIYEKKVRYTKPKQSEFVNIPKGWKIFPTPPFLRIAKPELPVMGLENKAWLFEDRNMAGQCIRPNCRSPVEFYAKEPLGHTFFFDIDEKVDDIILIRELQKISTEFKLSHMIITDTTKGHHIWVTEIRKHKVSWFPLFNQLKLLFDSDYEFMGQWILRINNKAHNSAPEYNCSIINHEFEFRDISKGHLIILQKYAKMDMKDILEISSFNIVKYTFARIVQYYTWNIPHRRGEHLEEF